MDRAAPEVGQEVGHEVGHEGDAAAFLRAAQAAVLMTDHVGTITFANLACETMLGYEAGTMPGLNVRVIVPERLRAPHDAGMAALVAGGRPRLAGKAVEVTAVCRDGHEIPIELSLSSWGSGAAMGIGAMVRDISERRRRDARLLRLAHHDPRTGLPNRMRLIEDLTALLTAGTHATVLALGIDGIRTVNETLGYAVGDAMLEALAVRLRARLDPDAVLARLAGDEFAVLLPDRADPAGAEACARTLIAAAAEPIAVSGHLLHVGTAVGAAMSPDDGADAEELLASADLALHQARRDGTGCVRLFGAAMRCQAAARRALQDRLRHALDHHELELHYQPQVALDTGRICGAEALIRWRHPERGLLAPSEFLSALDASLLSLGVGWWTLDEACRQNAAWRAMGLPPIRVGVNLFSSQLRGGTLDAVVTETLARHGLPPDALELEITETIALRPDEATLSGLHSLRTRGIGIAFDDFGTGFASLSTLKNVPLTKLKIDRGFVRDILADPHDAAIVQAVLGIGRAMALEVIAEGVETAAQAAALSAMGCRIGQGYLYGRALEPAEFAHRLAEGKAPAKRRRRTA